MAALAYKNSSTSGLEESQGASGAINVCNVAVEPGQDSTLDRTWGGEKWTGTYISTATTTLCKTGSGVLGNIVVGTAAAGAIQIYDAVTATNQKGELKASIAEGTYKFNMKFDTGLTIVTAAASKITVNWL